MDLQKTYDENDWKKELLAKMIIGITGSSIEKTRVYDEIGYFYQCYAPASLYKYYSDTKLNFETIKNNSMWYSAPCNFNDIFDCNISIDDEKIFNNALNLFPNKRGVRTGSPMWKKLKEEINRGLYMLETQFNELRNTTGISCFSEREDSLLMWAHYANNHRGICVEYNLLNVNKELGFTAVPIIYSNDRTCFDSIESYGEKDIWEFFIESLTSKSMEWNYEKEWRIIRDQVACGSQWDVNKKGALLKMIRPDSIILGCATNLEFEKEIMRYCDDNKIKLYKMKKDQYEYKLNKIPILKF